MNDTTIIIYRHNNIALTVFKKAMYEYLSADDKNVTCNNLFHCNAKVYETEHYYVLKSYNTFIAAIDKQRNIIVDVLRHEYKYTRTSAMHISKFGLQYIDKTRVSECFTWRNK